MSDYDSDNEDINYTAVPRGYLYEPEYTDAEIRQMELERAEREERAREEAQDEAGATAGVARDRVTDKWWCTCSKCQLMPTEVESYCCHEWDLIMPQMQNLSIDEEASAPVSVCITNHEDFPAILNAGVLQIFFNIPKPNWRRNPRPAGPDGLLSSETVGMHPDTLRFLCFSAVVLVPHIIGELLTVVLLGVVQNPNMVNSGVALLNIAGILVGSGFLRSTKQMPEVFQWLSYLTFQKYSCELLIVTEFHELNFTCSSSSLIPGACLLAQGTQIIDQGYPGALSRYTLDFVLLYAFLPALLLLGLASFKIRDHLIRH